MPLNHSASPAAFKQNVRTLMGEVGKSPHVKSREQALAIAYATQRRARADGGATFDDRFAPASNGLAPSWLPGAQIQVKQPKIQDSRALMASRGGVMGFDSGGTVDPVQAVITALSQGAGATASGVAPSTANPATTSSPAATTSTAAATPATTPAAGASSVQTQNSGQPAAAAAPAVAPASGIAPAPAAQTAAAPAAALAPTGVSTPLVAPANPSTPTPNLTAPTQNPPAAARGGGVANRAYGGFNMAQGPNLAPTWEERSEARQLHVGPVLSAVPGRTDNHAIRVPASSYVLPAAHVSALGHGNTNAGFAILGRMFGSGPYGTSVPRLGHGSLPRPPRPMGVFAAGGYSEGGARGVGRFEPVSVNVSGGEWIIPPDAIVRKFGGIKRGHKILDHWVMSARAKELKTLKGLPPPAKK